MLTVSGASEEEEGSWGSSVSSPSAASLDACQPRWVWHDAGHEPEHHLSQIAAAETSACLALSSFLASWIFCNSADNCWWHFFHVCWKTVKSKIFTVTLGLLCHWCWYCSCFPVVASIDLTVLSADKKQLTWSVELTGNRPGYIWSRLVPRQDRTPGLHCTRPTTSVLSYTKVHTTTTTPCSSCLFRLSVFLSVCLSRRLAGDCLLCNSCIAVWFYPAAAAAGPQSAKLRLAAAASRVSKQTQLSNSDKPGSCPTAQPYLHI